MVARHVGPSVHRSPKPAVAFRCPHCGLDLDDGARTVTCASGHVFNRAREGYVNLLVGGRLRGGPAGDDEAMVRARRAVFDAGCYAPVVDAVAAAVVAARPATLLDAGCGEGTYLARAAAACGAEAVGIDISRPAVRLAARRHRGHRFAVASSYRAPFADAAFDAVIDVFSPRPWDELRRVLTPGGVAVVATPGAGHLAQLRAVVYDAPRPHREDESAPAGFARDHIARVAFALDLADVVLRRQLLEMTPYWWSADEATREVVAATLVVVDVDVVLTTYRRLS